MKIWQVWLFGEGFHVRGMKFNCEISGVVEAESADAAAKKACGIATRTHPELSQAAGSFPRPVINANEIQEWSGTHPQSIEVDQVELHWIAAT